MAKVHQFVKGEKFALCGRPLALVTASTASGDVSCKACRARDPLANIPPDLLDVIEALEAVILAATATATPRRKP
jgi:recombinational DNA repair protein (RecF pathway)